MISSQVMSRFWPLALFIATFLLFVLIRHPQSLNISLEVPLPETSPPISSDPVSTLAGLGAIAPPVPINESCLRPPLPRVPACMDSAFSGEPLIRPRKLALMLLLGFEVDTLEIHLREAVDMVDVIFLVESTTTHHGTKKPLMWERLQYEERFQFVPATLVVHVIVNHLEDDMEKHGKSYWWFEDSETRAGVARARAWAAVHQRPEYGSPGTSRLSPDDLFISANTDEVMSREALHKLRWCKLNGKSPISGALWMPMGNLNLAFRSDFPVRGRPHTYGFPTIYRWEEIAGGREGKRLLSDYHGARNKYVLGGMHLTNPAFLPSAILKEISGTENGHALKNIHQDGLTLEELNKQQSMLYSLDVRPKWKASTDPIDAVTDISKQLPWFLECNPSRFPYWWGLPDPRNAALLAAITSEKSNSGNSNEGSSQI